MKALINGISLAYDDAGDGPAVILVHGFPLCRSMWHPQVQAITEAGFRLVTPDLRGFGESDVPPGPYSMALFTDDIISLMDHLHIDRAIIGGMSMGGYVLLNLLDRYPERCEAACFIATRSSADEESVRASRRTLLQTAQNQGAETLAEQCATFLVTTSARERNPRLVRHVNAWIAATQPGGITGTLPALLDRTDYSARLKDFTLPALVIGADQDCAIHPDELHILSQGLPDSELCILANAGHLVNLEQPELFNECLLRFIRKVSTRHSS